MKKPHLVVAALALLAVGGHASAAGRQMPIDFIGEWCNPDKEDGGRTEYALPSWSDGKCSGILSVTRWEFAFGLGGDDEIYCTPESIRTSQDAAPSGITYNATISASCAPGATPMRRTRRTFEFSRYKGHLWVIGG